MQNQNDLVVFWQLTKGTAYGSICDGIQSLRCRSTDSSVKKEKLQILLIMILMENWIFFML